MVILFQRTIFSYVVILVKFECGGLLTTFHKCLCSYSILEAKPPNFLTTIVFHHHFQLNMVIGLVNYYMGPRVDQDKSVE